MLLILAWTSPGAAEFVAPSTDGWHAWQVAAPAEGVTACCHQFRNGDVVVTGCDLDGRNGYSITRGEYAPGGNSIIVYVRIDDGEVTRIRALIASCPVTTKTPVLDHGTVAAQESVDWLARQIDDNARAEDALAAISGHSADVAMPALTTIVEDRRRRRKTREQALFWLAQLPSDAAFAYLDKLLSRD